MPTLYYLPPHITCTGFQFVSPERNIQVGCLVLRDALKKEDCTMVAVKDPLVNIDYVAYQANIEEFEARFYRFGLVFVN